MSRNIFYSFFRWIAVKNRIKYRNKCVLYIQKIVRGFLARKQHQPRYRGIIQIKSLKEKLHRSTDIVNQVRGGKDMILKQSNDIEHLMNGYVKNIQNDSRIPAKTIDKMYNDIMTKIDNYNNMIQTELKVTINNMELILCPAAEILIEFSISFRNNGKLKSRSDYVKFKNLLNKNADKKKRKSVECAKMRKIEES